MPAFTTFEERLSVWTTESMKSVFGFEDSNVHLGVIHTRMGEGEKAEEQFRTVLLKNPEDAAARHYLEP